MVHTCDSTRMYRFQQSNETGAGADSSVESHLALMTEQLPCSTSFWKLSVICQDVTVQVLCSTVQSKDQTWSTRRLQPHAQGAKGISCQLSRSGHIQTGFFYNNSGADPLGEDAEHVVGDTSAEEECTPTTSKKVVYTGAPKRQKASLRKSQQMAKANAGKGASEAKAGSRITAADVEQYSTKRMVCPSGHYMHTTDVYSCELIYIRLYTGNPWLQCKHLRYAATQLLRNRDYASEPHDPGGFWGQNSSTTATTYGDF
jgi:hypothetical protein